MAEADLPRHRRIKANGISLSCYEWPASYDNNDPALVIAHATGFHARAYNAIAEQFAGRRIVSLDLRGHGCSGGGPVDDWKLIASDVACVLEALDIRGAIGMGHSMGAHVLVQAAADRPQLFSRLVLFDPVIMEPEYYKPDAFKFDTDNPHPSIKRKRDFASPEAMIERFAQRDPYQLFARRVFEDYCRYGLIEKDDGGYELACAPEMEASIYASSQSNPGVHDAARTVDIPVLVVRAKRTSLIDFKSSPTWPELASLFSKGTDLHRPDHTHFHPFEDPQDAARIIREFECE